MHEHNQTKIIEKFGEYLALQGTSQEYIKRLKNGLCLGFCICYCSFAIIGKLNWWLNEVLKPILSWDGSKNSLTRELDYLFKRAINYVLFHQAALVAIENNKFIGKNLIKGICQENILNHFKIQEVNKKSSMGIKWQKLFLMPKIFAKEKLPSLITTDYCDENIVLIKFFFKDIKDFAHYCAVRYKKEKKEWCFFDPNFGERCFSDQKKLINFIIEHKFTIEIEEEKIAEV